MSQDLLAAFGDFSPQSNKPHNSLRPSNKVSSSSFDDFNLNSRSDPGIPAQVSQLSSGQAFADSAVRSSGHGNSTESHENDDDWGDFEGSAEVPKSTAASVPVATQFSRWLDEEDDGFPDWEKKNAAPRTGKWDFTKPDPPVTNVGTELRSDQLNPNPQPPRPPRDPNVLFDAEDEPPYGESEDDEFGDFEIPEESAPQPETALRHAATSDLLHIDDMPTIAPQMQVLHPSTLRPSLESGSLLDLGDLNLNDEPAHIWRTVDKSASSGKADEESTSAWRANDNKTSIHAFGTLGPVLTSPASNEPPGKEARSDKIRGTLSSHESKANVTKQTLPTRPRSQPLAKTEEEKWDDFDPRSQESSAQQASSSATGPIIPPTLTSETSESSISSPPTNIPPPALILSLFPPLFASAEASFFRPLRQETPEVQQAVYAGDAASTYLKGLLALATVCGRVIAGRKHRWKRDTILAQSMRIGPSAAGGVSGLKLASIDKAENAKEEREAADALKAWATQVGKLKSAIAEVKRIRGTDLGKVPELKETMPIRVAKEIEGGLKGHRPCALCGLKREERVFKVDFQVEDSFGEWWVDNSSMHRACRNFWEQHRDTLRQR
ncbi:uncharacterized protein PV09_02800 [Verruconis gallopava]|uniref:Serine/threonine-protein kinase ppk6 n=1 Tax=Verruconis gallopava TaxID=253628 RepID=A0A0D1Z051_9PEZI|nr:uncharacterized protein PV09_02800 [Verruconis gallopava]KIW06337.1 hypothetical protein PV09_02800 [Verruconis gallopava]